MSYALMLSDWFLLELEKHVAALKKLLRRIINALTSISVSLGRLILLLLKRTVSIIKNWLKENKIDEWLKTILHGSYISVFEGLYIFLYILHFFRAFLTLINYFTDQDNKNLVEVTKFLYACFKVFISLLMLTFMIMLMAHGVAPLGLMAYQHIKTLFRIYTFSKFAISFITLGFSFYKYKTCDDSLEQSWLKAHYKNNTKKHFEILLVVVPITLVLTIVGFGLATGPWFWIMIGIASFFLLVDMGKAIYYYVKRGDVPEPEMAILQQQNAFIDISNKDYYYRKCRIGRLKSVDPEANRIYLLKEIVVKIIQLQTKLKNRSFSSVNFFSEKPKILEKIEGLKQLASTLLTDDYEVNKTVLDHLFNALHKDYKNLNKKDKTLIPKRHIENFINEAKDISSQGTIVDELLHARDRLKEKGILYSQAFRQSFFRKKADCEDISDACQAFFKQSLAVT
ncbi:MAG: hypothetical protein WA659_03815 [Candidatus Aquirickettsiella sp.]